MSTNTPKLSITIDQLGDADHAGRAEITVSMKVDGITRVCTLVLEGKTSSPYTRTLEWDDQG